MTSHSASSPETHLERQARQLLVRIHSGNALPHDHESAAQWRAQSAEHEQAFQQMEQMWQLLGNLGSSAADASARIDERRRLTSPWFGAVAASLVGIAVCGWLAGPAGGVSSLLADQRTAAGEIRVVTLDDGSRVTLNGASAVNWQASATERRVELIAGEAHFEVAPDAQRPFLVTAGQAHIRVTGTAFNVQRLADSVVLTVSHGRVIASSVDGTKKVALTAGQALTWSDGAMSEPSRVDANESAGWMHGRLIVRDARLADIAAELERYRQGRIVLIGERARGVQLTGAFDSSDPDRILSTIAQTQGVHVYRVGPLTIVR